MTSWTLHDHVDAVIHHDSLLSRAIGVIPYQPVNDTAHLFTFDGRGHHSFHGLFVFQPLTLICLDDTTVTEIHVLSPFTTYTPRAPCDVVIELNANTDLTNAVNPGDTVKHGS